MTSIIFIVLAQRVVCVYYCSTYYKAFRVGVCVYYCSTYYKAVRVGGRGGTMEDMCYERLRDEACVD